MKDIYQVLREKEQAIARVRRELEALRFCAPMLAEAAEPLQPPASAPASPVVNRWPSDTEAHPPNPYQN
jgi:hypothetical protein